MQASHTFSRRVLRVLLNPKLSYPEKDVGTDDMECKRGGERRWYGGVARQRASDLLLYHAGGTGAPCISVYLDHHRPLSAVTKSHSFPQETHC